MAASGDERTTAFTPPAGGVRKSGGTATGALRGVVT